MVFEKEKKKKKQITTKEAYLMTKIANIKFERFDEINQKGRSAF